MMKQVHEHLKIHNERFCNVVVLIRSSWRCPSKLFFTTSVISNENDNATFRSLGRLNYMRIWHDNSGRGNDASWFLKYIVVRDLQTMEKSHFICQQWLAVEKDDGVVSWQKKNLPNRNMSCCFSLSGRSSVTSCRWITKDWIRLSAIEKDVSFDVRWTSLVFGLLTATIHTIYTNTTLYMLFRLTFHVDVSHLFSSILLFIQCVQRLMNIMYYDQSKEAKDRTAGGISLGPFFLTPEQV